MIVADENIHSSIIQALRQKGYSVYSITELHAGIKDRVVTEIVKQVKGVLLTEDKDFGELVFHKGIQNLTVFFLRYGKNDLPIILTSLLQIIDQYLNESKPHFIVITKNKIRVKELP